MKNVFKKVLLSDILKVTDIKTIESSSEAFLEDLLHFMGIDTKRGFERLTGLFRDPHDKTRVDNQVYWQGFERSDDSWVSSGLCSDEMGDYFRGKLVQTISKSKKTKEMWDYVEGAAKGGKKFD